jgi:hypothetical protein
MNSGNFVDKQNLKPETVAAKQKIQTSESGAPLWLGVSWWIGENGFCKEFLPRSIPSSITLKKQAI